ncbi:MAG: YebC/PmpR family DNA-binding transcriptional regulator [Pseudomonadota bacterium]
MSGHSKWANIKRRKGAQDAKRGAVFTKIIRELTVAARMGGADIDANPRLRSALAKAKGASMPRDTIQRAIDKGAGALSGENYEEIVFEGYGVGGVAIIVECLTDNRNRTTGDIRFAFTKYGGNLGTNGCVSYMFSRKGVIRVPAEGVDEDELLMAALDAGAEDMSNEGDVFEITTAMTDLYACATAIQEAGFETSAAELTYLPGTMAEVSGKHAQTLLKMVDVLEEHDDVQNVYTNADFDEETLAELG